MKNIRFILAAAIVAFALAGCEDDPEEVKSYYELDGEEILIDSIMFWYQSSMGGDPYIRLVSEVEGQDNPDLLKLYPQMGLGDLPNTYTWEAKPLMGPAPGEGTYDVGYSANWDGGMGYDWTAIGKEGCTDLVITEKSGEYRVEGTFTLSVGNFDFQTGEFIEEREATLKLDYTGPITPL